MSKMYDNWDRLVGAVLKREELRRLALSQSLSSSDFSFDSTSLEDEPSASRISNGVIYNDMEPIEFEEIKKAIKKYRPVEQGGIGIAFKGWIDQHTLTASKPGFGMPVAVQWSHGGPEQHREWLKEIKYMCQLHHPNLVKFIGYCLEEDNMILVYEFMSKGSLSSHLFEHRSLSWETRVKVATDVARGISFLHDREVPIIHRDIKTANILLDGDFNAKLTNFSLAKDGPAGGMTGVSTEVMGTYGYAAPEYVATGCLTTKCDVYGFGVVLLELLSGRRVYDRNRLKNEWNLVEWAKPYLRNKRKLLQIMDVKPWDEYPRKGAYEVMKLTSRCLSSDPKLRPMMDEVVVALEHIVQQIENLYLQFIYSTF